MTRSVKKLLAGGQRAAPEAAEDQLRARARQQEALAAIGQAALTSAEFTGFLAELVRRVLDALRVDFVAVWELGPDEQSFVLRAGVGWRPGHVGAATIGTGVGSLAGFALMASEPVLVPDVKSERRFAVPEIFTAHGVASSLSVPITGQPRPYGALSAHSARHREFSTDEVLFVRSVAHLLGAAGRHEQSDRALRDSEARLRAVVDTAVEGIITIDARGAVESMNPAARRMFGYALDEVVGRNISMLMPEPYQSQHDGYLDAYARTGRARIIGIGREVVGLRKDGSTFPLDLSVSEFDLGGRRMFTGVVRDITERRRLEREVLEAGAEEQRRIGQDLHDGLCQHLTGVAFAMEVLGQKLAARAAPETAGMRKTAELVDQAITQARELARGLQPVTLQASGLAASLEELAAKVEGMFGVSCLMVCDGQVLVHDNLVATHLYRIAQEAISNAVKHGKAKTIVLDLHAGPREMTLTITDDGVGLEKSSGDGRGIGLHTMKYRASLIGGTLDVRPGRGGGTAVTCVVPTGPGIETTEQEQQQRVPEHAQQQEDPAEENPVPARRARSRPRHGSAPAAKTKGVPRR
jgi:PAS domain S-box-containing protein